jgi:hypothetical protein
MIDETDPPAGDPDPNASELEGGGTDQTWGQGEGSHAPTIPPEDAGSTDDEEEDTPDD